MGIIGWIVLGGLAGWIASIIMGKNASMGIVANIVVGVIGAMIGGFLFSLFGNEDAISGFNLTSLLVATLGSVVLLWIVRMFQGSSTRA